MQQQQHQNATSSNSIGDLQIWATSSTSADDDELSIDFVLLDD